jgi:PAS domain S-box-containing protein
VKDMSKTKAQLIEELETLRVRNRTLEHSDAVRAQEPGRLELISRAAEQSTEGMAIVDLEGNLIFLNNSFANMHGYDPDELIGKNLSIFHTPDQMPSVNAANRELRETGTFSGEIWHTRRDGTVFPTLMQNALFRNQEGNPIGMIGTVSDITELKQTEEALQESEKNYRNLVDNALVGIFRRNIEGDIFYMNQAFVSMLEYDSIEELRAVKFADVYEDPGDRDRFVEALKEKGKVVGHELRLLTKTGKTRSVLVNGMIEHGIMSGMMMDITERKAMELELRQNEERHRALFEGSLDAIVLVDPETGEIVDANPAAPQLFLRKRSRIVGLHQTELYPLRLRQGANEAFARMVNDRDQDEPAETTILCSDGTERSVEVMAHIIQIDGRRVVYQEFRDISDRKRTADALQQTMERYRTLFDDSPISLWEEDYSEVKAYIEKLRSEGVTNFREFFETHPEAVDQCVAMVKILDVNQATLDLYEAKSKADFMAGLGQIFTEQSYEAFREGLIAVAEGKASLECEAVNQTFLGTRKDIQIRWSIPQGYEKTLARLLISVVDLTDWKRMEQELGNIQRLQALGVLAGGIAHDFNNILTAILANISMARIYGELDDDISQMLADAEKASLRAKGLTQQLLTFSKGGEPIKKTVRVSAFLQESAAFALSGSNTRCEYLIPDDIRRVEADEGQLIQVFQNLVINADQAMPEGGVVKIRAENVRIKEDERGELKEGDYVKLSVEDQGSGIPEEQLPKIFDPFFTTKERGRGLGLAIAFSIVNRHGGHMEVESASGGGTAFHVYLPASDTSAEPGEGAQDELPRGEGRVLVVDDEGIVRRSVGEVLKRLGYEVGSAKDGREGIELYEKAMEEGRPFNVVITDLTIPGELGGKQTVGKLRELDPDAKVIVSSGYSEDPVMSRFREYGFDGVLVKPYKVADLAEVIRKVLLGS